MTKIQNGIVVASPKDLQTKHYYRRLWLATKNIKIVRRDWLDEIADAIRDYDGVILNESGHDFEIGDIDEIFGDDPDLRWMGFYLQPDLSGENPKSHSRKFERLQLLDIYFKIRHPQIADGFY